MITIGRYRFEGPVYDKRSLKDAPGVYVILDDLGDMKYEVLDVGESKEIRTRIENHDRELCWRNNRRGRVCYATLYIPGFNKHQRVAIEQELRGQFAPACGVK